MIWHVQQKVLKCLIIPMSGFCYINWLIQLNYDKHAKPNTREYQYSFFAALYPFANVKYNQA